MNDLLVKCSSICILPFIISSFPWKKFMGKQKKLKEQKLGY